MTRMPVKQHDIEETAPPEKKKNIVAANALAVQNQTHIVRFRGRAMVREEWPYPHYRALFKDTFEQIAYPILGGVSRSRISDVYAFINSTAEDVTDNGRYIQFGLDEVQDDDTWHADAKTRIWDTYELRWVDTSTPIDTIWRSPYGDIELEQPGHVKFIMSLAGGDSEIYDDIMQSIAPLIMEKKPDGVIWWVGDGANGKSTLMDALYRIFPGHLASLTVKRLTDGRDAPGLNGMLANVVKESSEGRIDDTELYKAIGTHENFRVHKFHSQDDVEVRGNMHHIFSANTIPTFNDKGYSARRRTFIVPFSQRFESDPGFEERTFTAEMFGQLIDEMARYAIRLREQSYRYKFSATTLAAKMAYDAEANNTEEYAKDLVRNGIVAFDSYQPLNMDYHNWCLDNGFVALGMNNLRRAIQSYGFEKMQPDSKGVASELYLLPTVNHEDLEQVGMTRIGMYTAKGFKRDPVYSPTAEQLNVVEEPVPEQQSILKKDDNGHSW